ncbi:MAG: tRNA pseudouridine(55) synthase TruB [Thiomargarita sp.]|nr:tRNA pseudouridine(55) synthase TruB [Thiomargarita sp.]
MAKRRFGRNVHGILLLNKPLGISSNAALQRVKRLYQARKAGHTGSLDNLATGLLPICLGEATKLSRFLLEANKYYLAEVVLGETTTTGDAEGDVLQTRLPENIDQDKIDRVVQLFTGPIQQVPPMYSALKHKGQALYKLARQGKVVERKSRAVTIHLLKMHSWSNTHLSIEVHCSKGTYIRTLAEDIGEVLGCGAHLSALHRIGVGDYHDLFNFDTLEQLAEKGLEGLDDLLIPMQSALSHWPEVWLTDELTYYIQHGQPVQVSNTPTSGKVKLFAEDGRFLGIGEVLEDGRVTPKRLINL